MLIPFVNLALQNKKHRKEYNAAINQVIENANFINGDQVTEFESAFAKFCRKKFCVTVNSGTDALWLALLAYGIGPGDEVITAANSFFATASAIRATGAKAVFVDVDKQTYNINPKLIQNKITSRTRAIIPVHLYGQPADMDEIITISKKHNLNIIEDCCQAHGAKYINKSVPVTQTGAFSFYPGKNLGAFGDAGAVVTDNSKIADHVRLLKNHGSVIKYSHRIFGFNSRMDTIQAAILLAKLPYLDKWNRQRRQHVKNYNQLLRSVSQVTVPFEKDTAAHVYHIYAILAHNRDLLQRHLSAKGIATVIHYPVPIHLQPPFIKLGYRTGDFPVAEKLAKSTLSLPMFPEITEKEICYISKTIADFYRKN